MNRAQRRELQRAVSRAQRHNPAPASVTLRGGPMNDWVVKPNAACLRPEWWRTWPDSVAARWRPGVYELVDGTVTPEAKWRELA